MPELDRDCYYCCLPVNYIFEPHEFQIILRHILDNEMDRYADVLKTSYKVPFKCIKIGHGIYIGLIQHFS